MVVLDCVGRSSCFLRERRISSFLGHSTPITKTKRNRGSALNRGVSRILALFWAGATLNKMKEVGTEWLYDNDNHKRDDESK